jgi:hypothetical protein
LSSLSVYVSYTVFVTFVPGPITTYLVKGNFDLKLFEDKINTLESVEMQAVFIDYLPNNLSMTITKKDGTKIPVNVKDYYKTLFQLKTY